MPEPTPDPNAAPAGTPAPGTPAAGAPAGTPSLEPSLKDVLAAVAGISEKVAGFETRISQPAGQPAAPAAPSTDELDSEITLRKTQLAQIRAGQLAPEYEPEVQAALAGAMARKEGRSVVEREAVRGGFVNAYNAALQQAYTEFPELKDPNSEMYKETLRLLGQDRSYVAAQRSLAAKGRAAEAIDWNMFDPEIPIKVAARAKVNLDRKAMARPVSQPAPNPKAHTAALESGSGAAPAPGDDEIARLEAKASGPGGDRDDWLRVIKAREARNNARRAAAVQ